MGKASATTSDCSTPTTARATSATLERFGYGAPIRDLPTELLIEIFMLCTGDDAPLVPLSLSKVCRNWYNIIWYTPDVWRRISLDDQQRPIPASRAQAELWLAHSHSQPFDAHIQLSHHGNLLPLLAPILPHLCRCRSLEIAGKLEEKITFAHLTEDPAQAELYHLIITIKGEMELDDDESVSGPPTFTAFPPYLSSHTQLFNRLTMRTTTVELPLSPAMTTMHVRSLAIMENSLEVIPDPVRFIRFLAFCPQLEELRFSGYPHEPSPPAFSRRTPLPIAALPHLHTLVLRSTCAVRAILSHIDAPALRELYLEHTNMEFELRHAAAYTLEPSEGDSEDEAHDFSQSPWSDHGTGMGLRTLIKRSHPPLEVLDMNYADMRTKDFKWCFDHLNHLRDFRIVASDMSDKVISHLAPYRERPSPFDTSPDESAAGGGVGDMGLRMCVRLPRLASLELQNCHRLTGDAIVHALGDRVMYTDEFADGRKCRKLRKLGVISCSGFQPSHAMALLPMLGARLRTTE